MSIPSPAFVPAGPALAVAATLDASGLACPLPVLRARKRLAALPAGAVLAVLATDRAATRDFPAFCAATGHVLVAVEDLEAQPDRPAAMRFLIRRAGVSP
jgi:tRNA 2-thiouridine synthesizing protein A